MANIVSGAAGLIGNTPLVALPGLTAQENLQARVLVKLESRNPGGSSKDRVALAMIQDAENRGLLVPGGTIIEPTSGNTGIGLCAVAAGRGYNCIIVMPDSMSVERQQLMKAFGGQVVLTPGSLGMTGAIAEAERIQERLPGSFLAGQFENPANPDAHYRTTGPEIWADTDGQVDIFVAGIGTGGTITGTGRYLRERNPRLQVIGVEPADSPLLTEGRSGPHGIQGIGANFIPENLDQDILTRVVPVAQQDAVETARLLGRKEGILCGISAGAALFVALELAKQAENAGKTIVALLPDSGERYLSAGLYE